MYKYLFLSIIISFQLHSQKRDISIGKKEKIHSAILNENREIWVHVPKSFYDKKNSPLKYPVVYLLDGDSHFSSLVGLNEFLSESNGNTNAPEMIIVGILNTDRFRDLTPTHITKDLPIVDSLACLNTGGGEKFTSFLEKELIPYINTHYPTTSYKMLIGHSLGGLMVVNTFINHTELFNAYISIDPSLWWDNKKLVKDARIKLENLDLKRKSFYLGIANTMDYETDSSKIKKDTTLLSNHIRSIFEFDQLMKANNFKIQYSSKFYSSDTHISAPLITEYDAFRFIFKDYELKYTNNDLFNFSQETIKLIEKHYKNLEKLFGYSITPPEFIVNAWGYHALTLKKYDEALYLFNLNSKNYPTNWNVFDGLGDCYAAMGNKELAILNYKKAIHLHFTFESRSKLKALKKIQ